MHLDIPESVYHLESKKPKAFKVSPSRKGDDTWVRYPLK